MTRREILKDLGISKELRKLLSKKDIDDLILKHELGGVRKKIRKNPILAVMGNPKRGKVISNEVLEIRYIHAEDKEPYKHKFEYQGTKMVAMPDGSIRIFNPRFKLWDTF